MLKLLEKKVIIFDGGMGTDLASARKLKIKDQKSKMVCSEAYNLFEPEVVLGVHRAFIDAGCDVIETNTFNANRISLAEFGLEEKVHEINLKAVSIAKEAAKGTKKKIFVAGCIGPTSKLPSMGQVSFDDMYGAYREQIAALIEGGIDQMQIDTCQDLLQVKIAVIACKDVCAEKNINLPVIASVTIDPSGRMLLGSEPDAVLSTLVPLGIDAIGLNCGLGPEGMEGAVRYLAGHSPIPILVQPNAGLPEIVDGEASYNLNAVEFARWLEYYVTELGIEMVGGCCGTRPEHIAQLAKNIGEKRAKKRKIKWEPSLSSLFYSTKIRQKPAPLIIGERMNINGSVKFRKYILADDHEAASQMSSEQGDSGAHAIDISVAYAGRDEIADMKELLKHTVTKSKVPIVVDSISTEALEAALKMIPGRALVNSINLEDGGEKARKILAIAKRFGAAVIALTIDEDGMARETEKKIKIAGRLIALCKEYGIVESDIFIDALTFTLAEPRAASFGSGARTLEAIKKIKKKHPDVNTILGVSNISYGFGKSARPILNSAFLQEAVRAGLDAAIIHAGQIVPLARLDASTVQIALDLIWNKNEGALNSFIEHFEGKEIGLEKIEDDTRPEEGVRLSIIRGDKIKITGFLDELFKELNPTVILNDILLPAMAEVGRLFDKGDIPLPFVLQSAEAMKVATDRLSSHFKLEDGAKKGRVVLATVRGDVHDIGKNLVDIIFSNNGYQVFNIGVKQPIENILKAAIENKADAIGLSGLLVESAIIMKGDLAELAHRGVNIPVICGGAALTKKFVEKELSEAYCAPVYYASDAFEGLRILEKIIKCIRISKFGSRRL